MKKVISYLIIFVVLVGLTELVNDIFYVYNSNISAMPEHPVRYILLAIKDTQSHINFFTTVKPFNVLSWVVLAYLFFLFFIEMK